jgi:hypothetical protein
MSGRAGKGRGAVLMVRWRLPLLILADITSHVADVCSWGDIVAKVVLQKTSNF